MITSFDNKRIKNVISLLEKAKARREQDAFVIEGIKLFEEVPESRILEVFVAESYKGPRAKLDKLPSEVVKDDVFKKMTDTLAETIQDPGNLGTIMRTAEGAGVAGVIMSSDTVDIYNPKTVRSTMGSIFRVPFVYCDDLTASVEELKASGVECYAAHLKGEKSCFEYDYARPTAFFIGNEGNGLSDKMAAMADTYIRIPMEGKLESLNAGISAAILTYEAKRQRDRNIVGKS